MHGPGLRRPPRLLATELLVGLVYHVSQPQGTLAAHLQELTGKKISDSAASQRRLTMPWEVFEAILAQALAPLADPQRQPEAFYAGLRLVGLDGTRFSCANTPQILGTMTKAASRRFDAAFAKLGCAVLVELGTHAPLAAAISAPDLMESEAALASQLLACLPEDSLLLGDRLYGQGAFIARLLAGAPAGLNQAFLLRVSQSPKPKVLACLADGSALVEVRLGREEAERLERRTLLVREVRGRVRAPGKQAWSEVRLWTSLHDAKAHPALALLDLYTRRWEQEIAYHELKVELRASGDLPLASHTPDTAAQEIAALLVALAMVARTRLQAAEQAGVAPLRVSFGRTLATLQPLWLFLSVGADILQPNQQRAFIALALERLAARLLPPRRARSSPRAVRQPIKGWPRTTKTHAHKGVWQYEVQTMTN